MISITTHDPAFQAIWNAVGCQQEQREVMCVALLRALHGVSAVHPDDGWVDRKLNKVSLVNPAWRGQVGVGALIALGWPDHGGGLGTFRIVQVTAIIPPGLISAALPDAQPSYQFIEVVPQFAIPMPE